MPRIGPWELILILAIVLIVFGVGKLPQVGGALGKAVNAFRKGQAGEENEAEQAKARAESKKNEAEPTKKA